MKIQFARLSHLKYISRKIYTWCAVLLVTGLAMSFVIFLSLRKTEALAQRELLSDIFSLSQNSIQKEIDKNLDALHALKASFIAHKGMSRTEFGVFSSYYTKRINSIQALEWVPRVTEYQRDSFELAVRNEGFIDFEITQNGINGVERAAQRKEYYPVCFIEPMKGNRSALGFDPGPQSLQRSTAINKAIRSGEAASSSLMKLIQRSDEELAILVFSPIYNYELKNNSDSTILGLMEGVFLIEDLINSATSILNIPDQFAISIIGSLPQEELIYGNQLHSSLEKENIITGRLRFASNEAIINVYLDQKIRTSLIGSELIFGSLLALTFLITSAVFRLFTDNRNELRAYAKGLERQNEELEQYAYVASHDLQEPLRSMSGLVNIFSQEYADKLDENGKQYLEYMIEASSRMSALITDLLNYSRIGKFEVPQTVDCNSIIDEVEKNIFKLIDDSNAIIIRKTLPLIEGYPTGLKQLFQNLLTNAIKFQNNGNIPKIEISANRVKGKWQFMVKDNGIGIPEDYKDSVFTIFKRLNNKRDFEGTGIGLTFCKKIVDMHKGEIWVESKVDHGSKFCFNLSL